MARCPLGRPPSAVSRRYRRSSGCIARRVAVLGQVLAAVKVQVVPGPLSFRPSRPKIEGRAIRVTARPAVHPLVADDTSLDAKPRSRASAITSIAGAVPPTCDALRAGFVALQIGSSVLPAHVLRDLVARNVELFRGSSRASMITSRRACSAARAFASGSCTMGIVVRSTRSSHAYSTRASERHRSMRSSGTDARFTWLSRATSSRATSNSRRSRCSASVSCSRRLSRSISACFSALCSIGTLSISTWKSQSKSTNASGRRKKIWTVGGYTESTTSRECPLWSVSAGVPSGGVSSFKLAGWH